MGKKTKRSSSSTGMNSKTLSGRLAYALKTLGLSQTELARRIGVQPQLIQYLCTSKAKKSAFTFEMADALGISSGWLANGDGFMRIEDDPKLHMIKTQKRVPIIEWHEITSWLTQSEDRNTILNTTKEFILSSIDSSDEVYALRIADKSMCPRFMQDSIIIVEPMRTPRDNEFVVVHLKNQNEIIFRQTEIKEGEMKLKPLNSEFFKTIVKDPFDRMLGVVIEARWFFNT